MQRRVVDIAFLTTAEHGGTRGRVQRGVLAEAFRQVGVGEEAAAKGNQLDDAAFQFGFCRVAGVGDADNQRLLDQWAKQGDFVILRVVCSSSGNIGLRFISSTKAKSSLPSLPSR